MREASVPLTIERTSEGLRVILPDITLQLKRGIWSPHVIIRFSTGIMGKVSAVTRMVCSDAEQFPSLFVLPMQINPKETNLPLSSPVTFGNDLWEQAGPYLTLGMPEDTNGLKDELISSNVFLNLCDEVFAERERMMNKLLDGFSGGIFACVFDTLDRVQHMFWQDRSGLQSDETKEPTGVVAEWYRRMDSLAGRIIQRIGELCLRNHRRPALFR